MAEQRNNYQVARKDAKNCFVESLNRSGVNGCPFVFYPKHFIREDNGIRLLGSFGHFDFNFHSYHLAPCCKYIIAQALFFVCAFQVSGRFGQVRCDLKKVSFNALILYQPD